LESGVDYRSTTRKIVGWAQSRSSNLALAIAFWSGAVLALAAAWVVILPIYYSARLAGTPARVMRDRKNDPVRSARGSLKHAERALAREVKTGEKAVEAAEKAHSRRVRQAEQTLSALRSSTGARLASYRGITLFERWIKTPQGEGSLIGGQATADTAGNLALSKRPTLTRMAAGGLLLGPVGVLGSLAFQKKQMADKRELYLMVETGDFAAVVQCPADDGMKARQFAARINTAAIAASKAEVGRPEAIRQADARLVAVKADTTAIEAAGERLADTRQDPTLLGAIAVARREVEQVESQRLASVQPAAS
jgi:hypothetical protein